MTFHLRSEGVGVNLALWRVQDSGELDNSI